MGTRNGRSATGVTDLLQNILDDTKDFVTDEILDRGADTERDLRRAGRNWSDDDSADSSRGGSSRGSSAEISELRDAVKALTRQVDAIARSRTSGVATSEADLPIANYDELTAEEINGRLPALSQDDLGTIKGYERGHAGRVTVLERIESLQTTPPWPGFDEQTVPEIRKLLTAADDDTAREVRDYERRHKNRQGVLDAANSVLDS